MGDQADDERLAFIVEWYDEHAAIIRRYQFLFYTSDNSVEMYDIKNRRVFLKRTRQESVRLGDLYMGSTVNFHSRCLNFVDYGDEYTRRRLCSQLEKTLAVIKPDAIANTGQIIDMISQRGFNITKLKMVQLTKNEAFEFYQEHQGKSFIGDLLSFISSGPCVAMELMGEGVISRWREMLGPTSSADARTEAPMSIRARFGTDNTRNACHGSDSVASAAREIEFFFPSSGTRQNTAQFSDCTCAVIKPSTILAGQTGKILTAILDANFEISAMQMFHIEKANAEEFYEVYKGVVQEYNSMVMELTSGPCIALEIRAQDAPVKFREMVGPADPEIARHLRPRTLRAIFGKDKVKNAVHCTDLPEDGLLEVEYFFKILDR